MKSANSGYLYNIWKYPILLTQLKSQTTKEKYGNNGKIIQTKDLNCWFPKINTETVLEMFEGINYLSGNEGNSTNCIPQSKPNFTHLILLEYTSRHKNSHFVNQSWYVRNKCTF